MIIALPIGFILIRKVRGRKQGGPIRSCGNNKAGLGIRISQLSGL